jgi:hypothetical protein
VVIIYSPGRHRIFVIPILSHGSYPRLPAWPVLSVAALER